MKKGLKSKLAGQVGEYLVCAELGRRGLIATSFTGNVPEFDLIVANDSLQTLPIQVKTSRGHSWPTSANRWIDIELDEEQRIQIDHGNLNITNPELIYVCVALAAPEGDAADRFFILTKQNIQSICSENYREYMNKHNWKRPKNFRSYDNRYDISNLEVYEDNWQLIQEQLD
ncbi:hypothetical protein [Cobetia amphilecti]|uniref:hypothetical protein n=1 Tax=Cobetia amphilecti TaxID=1055104 RepID=UPI0026E467EE|nr:hypothetical protein [Cobetia amphilecti]MDO6814112.1 hypothetical protein [Cobetia amphilecti]